MVILNMYARKFFPKYFAYTVEALKEIGAIQTYEKFKNIYQRYSDMQEYDIDRVNKDCNLMEEFDDWFYKYTEDLTELNYQYILRNLI